MNFFKRIYNLWKLSAYEPGQAQEEYKTPGTEISMIVKKPPKQTTVFIPRIKITPAEQIINESKES